MGTVNRMRLLVVGAVVASVLAPVLPDGRAADPPPATCGPLGVTGGEWRSYGHDFANTRVQDHEKQISPGDVPFLAPAWTFSSVAAGGEGDFTGTPVVADGCLFVASNRGWVFALNADTGAPVWKAQVPRGGGVSSSVAVADGLVVAAVSIDTGPYVVAFDQATGAVRWTSDVIDRQPGADVYGSPVVFDGLVFEGVSGGSAELGDETDRYAFQGSFVLLDAATGGLVKKTWTIHPPQQPDDDFAGAGVWSTPAVDTDTKYAYVGTANPFEPKAEHAHANAVIKVDLDRARPTFGEIVGSYKGTIDEYVPGLDGLPCYDIPGNPPPYYPQGIGSCGDIDLDFGASPNLFRSAGGRLLVGAGQKSGVYHVFDAATMAPVWKQLVGPPSAVGGIVGSTTHDGAAVYGPVTAGGYVWSISADGGAPRWLAPLADGAHWGEPVTVANGVVYTVDLTGFLDGFDARTGAPLVRRPIAVGSGTGADPALSWGGVSVARNTVYAAVGISSLANGFVVAFRPGGVGAGPGPSPGPGPGPSPGPGPGGGGPTVVAGPGAFASTYATPVVTASVKGTLSFANADLPQHDVVAVDKGADGEPLFRSRLAGLGEVVPVDGLDRLQAGGSYAFFCSVHPGMKGTLLATG